MRFNTELATYLLLDMGFSIVRTNRLSVTYDDIQPNACTIRSTIRNNDQLLRVIAKTKGMQS